MTSCKFSSLPLTLQLPTVATNVRAHLNSSIARRRTAEQQLADSKAGQQDHSMEAYACTGASTQHPAAAGGQRHR